MSRDGMPLPGFLGFRLLVPRLMQANDHIEEAATKRAGVIRYHVAAPIRAAGSRQPGPRSTKGDGNRSE